MRLELVKNIKGNEVIGKNIYNQFGALILPKGQRLQAELKNRLLENGVYYVYLNDEYGDKIYEEQNPAEEKIEKLKQDTLSKLPNVFNELLDNNFKSVIILMDTVDELVNEILKSDIINTNLYEINRYDDYTYIHCLDTAIMSIFLGKSINLSVELIKKLGLSAILHDIGKTKIANSIINKKGRLTSEEFSIIRQHPKLGFDTLKASGFEDRDVLSGILYHHERYDGGGYPSGLTGNEIELIPKIISVSDVYTAVSANRSYRSRFSPNEAYEYILGGSGTIFDPLIISKFKETFSIYPIGCKVRLSNGKEGFISRQNKNFPDRPIVNVDKIHKIDLLNETKLSIIEASQGEA